jgi:hypothetical protein
VKCSLNRVFALAMSCILKPNMEKSELFREALRVLIRTVSTKRLASLGGKAPKMKTVPRRQAKVPKGS